MFITFFNAQTVLLTNEECPYPKQISAPKTICGVQHAAGVHL